MALVKNLKNYFFIYTCVFLIIIALLFACSSSIYTDNRDGRVYKTVKIGTQTWMAENLAYKAKKGCWAYNNDTSNITTYGYLYNWKTAKTVCPKGWHLPSDAEWTTLTDYLGGENIAGGKIKEKGNEHWNGHPFLTAEATNESGFTALPGGFLGYKKEFLGIGYYCAWWTASDTVSNNAWAWIRSLDCDGINVCRLCNFKKYGFSVRCVKDK